MNSKMMIVFTRTPLHVGIGSGIGAIDQPISRERHTGFPVIPGSSVKGVLRDFAEGQDSVKGNVDRLFGHDDPKNPAAGKLGFGEARIVAFPLRSAKGSFALATSPMALSRYARDRQLALTVPQVEDGSCLAGEKVTIEKEGRKQLALEEYVFAVKGQFPEDWAEHLSGLLEDAVLKEGKTHFVLLSDGDFAFFCQNACQIQHHNRIGEDGVVENGALFNTETVPSETLFYAPLHALCDAEAENPLFALLFSEQLLQFGGDSTTGLGFCTVKLS